MLIGVQVPHYVKQARGKLRCPPWKSSVLLSIVLLVESQ